MKKYKLLNGILLVFLLNSCDDNLSRYKEEVINHEDITAYTYLKNDMVETGNHYNLMPYALKMQEKGLGYFDFFDAYVKIKLGNKYSEFQLDTLPEIEKQYLIFILEQGASFEDVNCKNLLIKYYKTGVMVKKNLVKSDSIYKTFDYPKG